MPPEELQVHRFAHESMATIFEIFVAEKEVGYAGQAARAAFDEVERIERLFSRFDPSSETSRIGRLQPGGSLRIGVEMAQVLGLAAFIQAETGGAFDVNYLGSGRRGGSRARSRVRPWHLSTLLLVDTEGPGFEVTRVRPERGVSAAPLDLDFGALGKGYALDAALAVLRDWDIGNVLLHAGTSTALAAGPGPGKARSRRGWPVGVGAAAGALTGSSRIVLENRSLSGSGTEVKGDHIIDPRTGRPAGGHLAAWASHPSAAAADALSTAFLVMATGEVAGFCRRHPEVWALVKKEPKKCRIFNAGALGGSRPAGTRRER